MAQRAPWKAHCTGRAWQVVSADGTRLATISNRVVNQEAVAEIMASAHHLKEASVDLLGALKWIRDEAGQYADGAEDAHHLAKLLTVFEQKARAAIQRAEEKG